MKIAEFFAELGFDIKGDAKLADVDKALSNVAANAIPVLGAIAGMNVGFFALVHSSLQAAIGFKNFTLQTGLSLDKLRTWQHLAEVNDVSQENLTETVKGLQSAMAEIRLGKGNIAPWQLLGISPNTDPFTVLELLRKKLQTIPPDMGRVIAGQMGIGDQMFQMLRNSNKEFDILDRNLIITGIEQEKLIHLNRHWNDFKFALSSIADRLVSMFTPALTKVVQILDALLLKGAAFLTWLNKSDLLSTIVRRTIVFLGLAFIALTLVAGALVTALEVAALAMHAFTLASSIALAPILALLGPITLVTAEIAILYLLMDDFWASIDGKKHLINWPKEMAGYVNLLTASLEEMLAVWTRIKGDKEGAKFWQGKADLHHAQGMVPFVQDMMDAWKWLKDGQNLAAPTTNTRTSSVRQENNVQVHINGAADPHATGAAAGNAIRRELTNAAYQVPQPAN